MIEVSTDHPVPPHSGKGPPRKYPWEELEINKTSFWCAHKKVRGAATAYGNRHGMKFKTLSENDGVRVWRIE